MYSIREKLLHSAFDLMQQGKQKAAASIVARIVKSYPNDYHAWWLFANVAKTQADTIMALENVLRLRPQHERARRMLAQIRASNMKLQRVQTIADDSTGDIGRVEVRCRDCGAFTSIVKGVILDRCTFCGGSHLSSREGRDIRESINADFLVSFEISRDQSILAALHWFNSSWIMPTEFLHWLDMGRFTPIYLPYWSISAEVLGVRHIEEHEPLPFVDLTPELRYISPRAKLRGSIRNLLVPATTWLGDFLIEQIADYQLGKAEKPFKVDDTAGVQIQIPEAPPYELLSVVRRKMYKQLTQQWRDAIEPFPGAWLYPRTTNEVWHLVLLPAYIATYRYQHKAYTVMVNGQTGKVSGQRPVDWLKVWSAIIFALAPGVITLGVSISMRDDLRESHLQGLVFFPAMVLGLGMILAWNILREAFSYDNV